MRIAGKEINDECVHCGEILECELFKQGHGIRQERTNVVQMIFLSDEAQGEEKC